MHVVGDGGSHQCTAKSLASGCGHRRGAKDNFLRNVLSNNDLLFRQAQEGINGKPEKEWRVLLSVSATAWLEQQQHDDALRWDQRRLRSRTRS